LKSSSVQMIRRLDVRCQRLESEDALCIHARCIVNFAIAFR